MKKLLIVLILSSILFSCQNENSNPTGPDVSGNNKYLNGNAQPKDSYFPTSNGSWWKYTGILQGSAYSQKITCKEEKIIDGVYYATLYSEANGTTTENYLRVQNNEYYEIGFYTDLGAKKEFELCLLKASKSKGETWTSNTIIYKNSPNHFIMKIISTDDTEIVKGKNYKDVMIVNVIGEIQLYAGVWFPVTSFDMYFAKGIGLIKSDYGNLGKIELEDYLIK